MTPDEFERIADEVLAGTADARERERLEAHVASDAGAREVWANLRAAHAALAEARLEPAPPGLRAEIQRAIQVEARARRGDRPWLAGLVASFRARPALALGTTFSLGLVVGVLAFGALRAGWQAGRELASSTVAMMPAPPQAEAPVAIEAGGATVEVSVGSAPGGAVVRLTARQAAEVALEWEPGHGRLTGLRAVRGGGDALSAAPGRAALGMEAGSVWWFTLAHDGAGARTVRVTVGAAGRERDRTLPLPG
jgi:anti-sigma-K factor RskA